VGKDGSLRLDGAFAYIPVDQTGLRRRQPTSQTQRLKGFGGVGTHGNDFADCDEGVGEGLVSKGGKRFQRDEQGLATCAGSSILNRVHNVVNQTSIGSRNRQRQGQ
jgi:hypothetical protein